MPETLLRRAAALDKALRGVGAKLTPDRVGYMVHPDWASRPDHAVPKSLWRPQIPSREGLKATADWYRKNRWLGA
jgi:nucleoside-diphosphate-sugar epimerase